MSPFALVSEFHRVFDVFELASPGVPPVRSLYVRQQLILGELSELCMGLAAEDEVMILDALCDLEYVIVGTVLVHGWNHAPANRRPIPQFNQLEGWKNDDVAMGMVHDLTKNIGDYIFAVLNNNQTSIDFYLTELIEVMDVTWKRFGLDDIRAAAFTEVHRSNMSKLDDNGNPIRLPGGEIGKGPGFFEPNLKKILDDRKE